MVGKRVKIVLTGCMPSLRKLYIGHLMYIPERGRPYLMPCNVPMNCHINWPLTSTLLWPLFLSWKTEKWKGHRIFCENPFRTEKVTVVTDIRRCASQRCEHRLMSQLRPFGRAAGLRLKYKAAPLVCFFGKSQRCDSMISDEARKDWDFDTWD